MYMVNGPLRKHCQGFYDEGHPDFAICWRGVRFCQSSKGGAQIFPKPDYQNNLNTSNKAIEHIYECY